MARNPNTSHPNKNTLYLACSGGGKSQAVYQNPDIPKRGVRHFLWDIDHDHKATRYESMSQFLKAAIAGIKSGRGFRIAFSGDDTSSNFERFCRIVWEALDGKFLTYVTIEELADVSPSVSKATPEAGRLLRKGRKFGARIHATTQRGAEIPKTAYTQCPIKYVGQQEGDDIKKMSKVAGVTPEKIAQLNPLNYYRKEAGPNPPRLIKLKYKPPT